MECNLKVLHIINSLGSGGAEKLIEDIVPLMSKKKNIEVEVLLLTDENNVFDEKLKKFNVKIYVVPLKKSRNLLNIYYIRKHIVKGNYDIIHAHLFPTLYWVSIASKLIIKNKPKFIYTEHSTWNRRRSKKYLRSIEKWIYSGYNKIISISEATERNLTEWLNPNEKDKKKFVVINNGIDIEIFKIAKPYKKNELNINFTDDTKILCMVGSFSESKDQATIIKAMKNLEENIHLILIGEGPLKEINKKLSKELKVNERVHFLGFRKDIPRILKTSDIIIQSSNWEGFGLAAVEGMAAAKPVIASDVPGLSEVIGGAGNLFNKGNYRELICIIKKLLNDENNFKEVKKKYLEQSNKYDINNMVNKYIRIYKSN